MTRGEVQRYTVFYHDELRQWAMAPPGDGRRAVFWSHAEAIAYADRQARDTPGKTKLAHMHLIVYR